MIDVTALKDQWQAQQRDYAGWCISILETYLDAGHVCTDRAECERHVCGIRNACDCGVTFTRCEAFDLLNRYLDYLEDYASR